MASRYEPSVPILAPSHSALTAMIHLAENYFSTHGLQFSTDPDPKKSKTKCIAWLQKERPLAELKLCGNYLPWVGKITHLGITITNSKNILETDMNIKKARYVARNIELNQEFHFASDVSKLRINDVYNSSWYGSVLYNIYSTETVKIESSYNRSVKIIIDLPYETHRSLIEPVSGLRHLSKTGSSRFLVMINSIRKSKKNILKCLLSEVERDVRSISGRNMRMIMLQREKSDITEVSVSDADKLPYHDLAEDEDWRTGMLLHLMEERREAPLDTEDLEWLNYLCCN
jgi:hypothetical protein